MNYSTKGFLVAWLTFLALLSLILTGAFWLGAHGNEFGSTTITSSTNSTTFPPSGMTTSHLTRTYGNQTVIHEILVNSTSSTSESSRAVSDYGPLAILLVVVLAAVLIINRVAVKRMKK